LTTREREVLTLIASGKTTRDIAQDLGIAFKTVAVHRSRLMIKLGASNMADMTRAAIRMELIKP
jgi:DNA-binding NarL/FixJ family response regulator